LQLGLTLLALVALGTRRRTAWLPLLLLWPGLSALFAPVWKETLMSAFLLCACACIERERRAAGVALLLLACALRHEAVVAAAPLLAWVALAAESRAKRAARLLGLVGCAVLLPALFSRVLTAGRSSYTAQEVLVDDLIALSLADGRNLLPAGTCMTDDASCLRAWQAAFDPQHDAATHWARLPMHRVQDGGAMARVVAAWARAVVAHPGRYAAHRWQVSAGLLGARAPENVSFVGQAPNPFGYDIHPPARARWAIAPILALAGSFVFRGWFYVALSAIAWVIARDRAPRVLALSGLGYLAGLVVMAPESQYRFLAWPVMASVAGFAMALLDRRLLKSPAVGGHTQTRTNSDAGTGV
jgi:hypothetical protein